jgi:hypothetical protein
MGPQGRVFPARHQRHGDGYVYALTDMSLRANNLDSPDDSVTYTVVWPDTGQDSVTVDSPNRFRITDIPVEDE